MISEQVTIYKCELCGTRSENKDVVLECEQDHKKKEIFLSGLSYWGRKMVENVGVATYLKAKSLLKESKNQVEIYETDELGDIRWAIGPVSDPSFWLESFTKEKEAVRFCKTMEWKVVQS